MAFKMKGFSGFKAKEGEPSTSVTENLLRNLSNSEEVLADKAYRVAERAAGTGTEDAEGNVISRESGNEESSKALEAKSDEQYIAELSKMQASSAASAEKEDERKAEIEANKAEIARRNALSPSERRKEDRAKKKARNRT